MIASILADTEQTVNLDPKELALSASKLRRRIAWHESCVADAQTENGKRWHRQRIEALTARLQEVSPTYVEPCITCNGEGCVRLPAGLYEVHGGVLQMYSPELCPECKGVGHEVETDQDWDTATLYESAQTSEEDDGTLYPSFEEWVESVEVAA